MMEPKPTIPSWKVFWQGCLLILSLSGWLLLGSILARAFGFIYTRIGVDVISEKRGAEYVKAGPSWPLVFIFFVFLISIRHRDALDFWLRNMRWKHGETTVDSVPQPAIAVEEPESKTEIPENELNQSDTPEERAVQIEIYNLKNRIMWLANQVIYYQLTPSSKELLRRLVKGGQDGLSSKQLNAGLMQSQDLTNELKALTLAQLIERIAEDGRTYRITDKGQQVMSFDAEA